MRGQFETDEFSVYYEDGTGKDYVSHGKHHDEYGEFNYIRQGWYWDNVYGDGDGPYTDDEHYQAVEDAKKSVQ